MSYDGDGVPQRLCRLYTVGTPLNAACIFGSGHMAALRLDSSYPTPQNSRASDNMDVPFLRRKRYTAVC